MIRKPAPIAETCIPGMPSAEGQYTYAPKCLPIDWLECRFSIGKNSQERPWGNDDRVELGALYALERLPASTRMFSRMDRVIHCATGTVVGELRSCPRNEQAVRANAVLFKVANPRLYDHTWFGHTAALMDGLGWTWQAVTKLDLAADGHGFLAPWAAAQANDIQHGGRSPWTVGNYPGVKGVRNIEVSNRGANKFARIYKKSEEILKSGKVYIPEYWSGCGLANDGNVERCELSVKGRELRRYADGAVGVSDNDREFLEVLTEPAQRARLYLSMASTFIRFYVGGDRSRDRVDVLNWDMSQVANGERVTATSRAPRVLDIGLNLLKQHIGLSYMLHVATDSPRYLATAQEVAAASNLLPWLDSRRELLRRRALTLNASGLRASNLFDGMQGVDDALDEAMRARPDAASERTHAMKVDAERRRVLGSFWENMPAGYKRKYLKRTPRR